MTDTAVALEAVALGKRFGRRGGWALRDCSFRLPVGRVCAVVGPNGAGKSTLLAPAAGLLAPGEGRVAVLGTHPGQARARVGFVAQDKPLYPQLTVAGTLRMGADLNPGRWDEPAARRATSPPRGGSWTPATWTRGAVCAHSPAASAPVSPSPWRWASGPSCCSWTSRWPTSTPWPGTS